MAEHIPPSDDPPSETASGADSSSASPPATWPSARYLRLVDNIRKGVAIAMGVCGVAVLCCAGVCTHYRNTLGQDPGGWEVAAAVFTYGMAACVTTTSLLVVEALVRVVLRARFTLRSLLLLVTAAAVLFATIAQRERPWVFVAGFTALVLLAALWARDREQHADES